MFGKKRLLFCELHPVCYKISLQKEVKTKKFGSSVKMHAAITTGTKKFVLHLMMGVGFGNQKIGQKLGVLPLLIGHTLAKSPAKFSATIPSSILHSPIS